MAERPPLYTPKYPRHWAFRKPRKQENQYFRDLMRVVRHIAEFLSAFDTKSLPEYLRAAALLENYSETVRPWAERVAERMVERMNLAEFSAWDKHSKEMSRLLRRELKNAPTGIAARNLVQYQVELITSLPREAAQRVQRIAIDNLASGKRADAIAKEIMATGEVTKSRAMLIARTETGRAQTSLTQARALSIGSPGYIWHTVGDTDVRPSHRKLEGAFIRWDSPPTTDGLTYHAGCGPNCRCYCAPIIPEL